MVEDGDECKSRSLLVPPTRFIGRKRRRESETWHHDGNLSQRRGRLFGANINSSSVTRVCETREIEMINNSLVPNEPTTTTRASRAQEKCQNYESFSLQEEKRERKLLLPNRLSSSSPHSSHVTQAIAKLKRTQTYDMFFFFFSLSIFHHLDITHTPKEEEGRGDIINERIA